jgi:hypothetical protein
LAVAWLIAGVMLDTVVILLGTLSYSVGGNESVFRRPTSILDDVDITAEKVRVPLASAEE